MQGPVEWLRANYYPNVFATNGTRDRWTSTGTFKVDGPATTVEPIGTVAVNNAYAVLEAGGTFIDGNNGKLPVLPQVDDELQKLWGWSGNSDFVSRTAWYVERKH